MIASINVEFLAEIAIYSNIDVDDAFRLSLQDAIEAAGTFDETLEAYQARRLRDKRILREEIQF